MQEKDETAIDKEKLQRVIFELYTTEETFNKSMQRVKALYEQVKDKKDIPQELRDGLAMCANLADSPIRKPGNITKPSDIQDPDAVIGMLHTAFNSPEYRERLAVGPQAAQILQKYGNHPAFATLSKMIDDPQHQGLGSFMIQPTQRVPRYKLLFDEIRKLVHKESLEFSDSRKSQVSEMVVGADATAKRMMDYKSLYDFSQNPSMMSPDVILGLEQKRYSPEEMKKKIDALVQFKSSHDFLTEQYQKHSQDPKKAAVFLALIAVKTEFTPAQRMQAYLDLSKHYTANNEPTKAKTMLQEASKVYNDNINQKPNAPHQGPNVVLSQLGKVFNSQIADTQGIAKVVIPSLPAQREYLELRINALKEQEKQLSEDKAVTPIQLSALKQEKAQLMSELKGLKGECQLQMQKNKKEAKAVLHDVEKLISGLEQKEPKTLMGRFKQGLAEISERRDSHKFVKEVCKDNKIHIKHLHVHNDKSATITVRDSSLKDFLEKNKIKCKEVVEKGEHKIKLSTKAFNAFKELALEKQAATPSPRH